MKYFPKIRYEQTANYGYAPNPKQQNVFMAVAMDLPDDQSPEGPIHPRDKASVADRLVIGARAIAYGEKNVDFQGPIIDSCDIVKLNSGQFAARVNFRNSELGIKLNNLGGFEVSFFISLSICRVLTKALFSVLQYSFFVEKETNCLTLIQC